MIRKFLHRIYCSKCPLKCRNNAQWDAKYTQLFTENERIKAKYQKLQKKNALLEKELNKIKSQFTNEWPTKRRVTTRSVQVQTDRKLISKQYVRPATTQALTKQPQDEGIEKSEKLLAMHTNLLKRYQKELKTNTSQVEQIASLTLENIELKQKLEESNNKLKAQEKENEALQLRMKNLTVKDRVTPSKRDLLADLEKVTKERDRLLQERKKFKGELKVLDRGFFEEIEDLKYALQQSAKLNSAYEAALRRLCTQFGVPLPSVTGSGKKRHRKRQQQREFK